jgi:hypothetical protein
MVTSKAYGAWVRIRVCVCVCVATCSGATDVIGFPASAKSPVSLDSLDRPMMSVRLVLYMIVMLPPDRVHTQSDTLAR